MKLDNPWASYPGGDPFPLPIGPDAIFPNSTPYVIQPPNTHNPAIIQYNLSVERQLATNWLVSISYLGSESYHLWMQGQANPAVYVPGTCSSAALVAQYGCTLNGAISTASNTNNRRALTLANPIYANYFAALPLLDSGGTSSYNGLVLSATHRLSSNFTVTGNDTWSHCISSPIISSIYGGTSGNGGYSVPGNPRADRSNCTTSATDVRNSFHASAVLLTPKFSNRTLRIIGTGWSFAPLIKVQSGDHLTVTTTTDIALNGNTSGQRIALVPGVNPYGSGLTYLNPAAFVKPATGTFSTTPPGYLVGPVSWQFDASIYRDFNVGKSETKRIEARVEAFNVTNSFRRVDPIVNFNSGQFGQITSQASGEIIIPGDYRSENYAVCAEVLLLMCGGGSI